MRFGMIVLLCSMVIKLLAPENNNTFLVPKKKRISTNALKENIGHAMGETLKISADFVITMGHIQKDLMGKMHELIEQDTNSFFAKASAQQLQTYDQALENVDQVMHDCHSKIKRAFLNLQKAGSLENSKSRC